MSNDKRVVIVTGGNRGIGYEAVKLLSKKIPSGIILLAARSQSNGDSAIQKLKSTDSSSSYDNVKTIVLDITSDKSVKAAVQHVESTYGKLDALINNSGIARAEDDPFHPSVNDVNVRATAAVTEAFLPLIEKANGTIIVVSSQVGTWYMGELDAGSRAKLEDVQNIDTKRVHQWISEWSRTLRDKQPTGDIKWVTEGAAAPAYFVSKALITAWCRGFAAKNKVHLAITCPGYCSTDMTGNAGGRPPSAGAASITWPLFNDFDSGVLYQDGKVFPYVNPFPENLRDVII